MTCIWGGDQPGTVVEVRSGWGNPATVIERFEIISSYGPYYYATYSSGITCVECSMKVVNCNVNGCHYHGIECYEAFVEIENTLVVGNEGDPFSFGAVIYGNTVDFSILNCTISDDENKAGGGGICIDGAIQSSKIKNTILWSNSVSNAISGDQIWLNSSAKLDISFSDVQGGQAEVYVEPGGQLTWGVGMMDVDPLFVHLGTDFHLRATSPCIDAGDGSGAPAADFENDPRTGMDMDLFLQFPLLFFSHYTPIPPTGFISLIGYTSASIVLGQFPWRFVQYLPYYRRSDASQ